MLFFIDFEYLGIMTKSCQLIARKNNMKIQDILFIVFFIVLLGLRKKRLFILSGLLLLFLSAPLYSKWIFFTAERFILYGYYCLITGVVLILFAEVKSIRK